MVGKKIATGLQPTLVTPQEVGDNVCCECGANMEPWSYLSAPSGRRSIMWRCTVDPDHVSAMIPLPKEKQ